MYSKRSGLIFGFHGCDESVRNDIVFEKGVVLKKSENIYDWLGSGAYFWENNYERALQYAINLKNNPGRSNNPIKKPAVLGAVLDLGHCLDTLDSKYLNMIKEGYSLFKEIQEKHGLKIPVNKPIEEGGDLLLRPLDRAVIETVNYFNDNNDKYRDFDSVRGVFFEGDELYPNAGFREKNHIQIAIRNPNCIKAYFMPRDPDLKYPMV